MSKYAIRGGHNFACEGASAIINETAEDRKVKDAVIKYLKLAGQTVVDVTPGNCSENADLNYGTNGANNANADFFIPIHFNKCYDTYKGSIGTEVWLNPNSATSVAVGNRILNKLVGLGFKRRGLKDGINGEHLHDIKASHMPAILIEICFVEATEDVALYKKLGIDTVGKAIAEGIIGKTIGASVPVATVKTITPSKTVIPIKIIIPAKTVSTVKATATTTPPSHMYRVRSSWTDEKSQKGAYTSLSSALDFVKTLNVYKVFDENGTIVSSTTVVEPQLILKVTSTELNVLSESNANSKIISTLPKGASVIIRGKENNFYLIHYEDAKNGYHGAYVSCDFVR